MISKVTGKAYPSHTREAKRSARLKNLDGLQNCLIKHGENKAVNVLFVPNL
jgi:endonuclease I